MKKSLHSEDHMKQPAGTGIAAAYESDKNDTTRMYYALSQLASISVDDSEKTLFTKNYGFTDYPAKLNSLSSTNWMKKYVSDNTSAYAPGFNVPSWLTDTEVYKNTLVNSAPSTQTISYLLAANVITCNPDGYNTFVDNILNLFGIKFMTVKQLVSELSVESVVIP
jgi:hypothetical protein